MDGGARHDELILLPALKAVRGPRGGVVLTAKYLDGAALFARGWPGPVTSLLEETDTLSGDLDLIELQPGEAETALELRPADPAALADRLWRAGAVLSHLAPSEAPTAALCADIGVPFLSTSEYSPLTERQIIDASDIGLLRRLRRRQWAASAERTRQRMLPMLAGLQCSGTPTYDLYRSLQPNALLFFDNRVLRDDVISTQDLAIKAEALMRGDPLRLVFGGRLVDMKGVMDLPAVADALRRRQVDFRLDIYGGGDLEQALARRIAELGLQDQVQLRGVLDFRGGWIPMLKREADLFVCCHPQGDPSSTYPEVMSCGVPIAGYANEAFEGVVRHSGSGWLSPLKDPEALADRIASLDASRTQIATAAQKARAFALAHAFEETFGRRAAHLVRSSRLPADLKDRHG